MFPDPFLPRVAVRVGKGSGYARLSYSRELQGIWGGGGVGGRFIAWEGTGGTLADLSIELTLLITLEL